MMDLGCSKGPWLPEASPSLLSPEGPLYVWASAARLGVLREGDCE